MSQPAKTIGLNHRAPRRVNYPAPTDVLPPTPHLFQNVADGYYIAKAREEQKARARTARIEQSMLLAEHAFSAAARRMYLLWAISLAVIAGLALAGLALMIGPHFGL
jgi:uncharacterized membrane protein